MLESLKRLWRVWKEVTRALVAVQNRVLVGIVFVFGVGATALWARVTRRRLLDRAPPPAEPPDTYWVPLPPKPPSIEEAGRPF